MGKHKNVDKASFYISLTKTNIYAANRKELIMLCDLCFDYIIDPRHQLADLRVHVTEVSINFTCKYLHQSNHPREIASPL